MKQNYDVIMREELKKTSGDKRLLLHSCCAPCSSYCISELASYFYLTVFYYNPNLDTDEEYRLRMNEQKRFLSEFPTEKKVEFVELGHCPEDFIPVARGRENLPEGGERCFECYKARLLKTARYAAAHGFDFFATTLTVSPLKNAGKINEIGFEAEKECGVRYLPTDFKKRGGYLKSIEYSKEYGLYRQNYCGCKYSRREKDPNEILNLN